MSQNDYNAIAGERVGLTADKICLYDKLKNAKIDATLCNRWLYVKKCKREIDGQGIIIPEKTRDDTNIALVLAVSEGCGKWHKLTKQDKKLGWLLPQVECDIKPGDKVIVPEDQMGAHGKGMMISPYGENEWFVHECVVIAKIEQE